MQLWEQRERPLSPGQRGEERAGQRESGGPSGGRRMRSVRPQFPWQVGEESSMAVWEGQLGVLGATGWGGRERPVLSASGKRPQWLRCHLALWSTAPGVAGALLVGELLWAGAEQHCGLEGLAQAQGSSCPWRTSES